MDKVTRNLLSGQDERAERDRKLRAQAKRDRRRSGIVSTQPVLETAFHRELSDLDYLSALERHVDGYWPA